MLLPKRITKKYTYNENESKISTYTASKMDQFVGMLFLNDNEEVNTTVKTEVNRKKITHVVSKGENTITLNEEQYKKCISIVFFKLGYHILDITTELTEDKVLNYKVSLCRLTRKTDNNETILKRKK